MWAQAEWAEAEWAGVNDLPVANAGPDQVVQSGVLVTLDGSASFDPDLDPITYLWTPPPGIILSDDTAVNPTFTSPLMDSILLFSLIVNDGIDNSAADFITVTVQGGDGPAGNVRTSKINKSAVRTSILSTSRTSTTRRRTIT